MQGLKTPRLVGGGSGVRLRYFSILSIYYSKKQPKSQAKGARPKSFVDVWVDFC